MEVVMGPDNSPEQALCRLVETHQVSLLRLCYVYLHDRSLAEDAVQETFIKAYKALSSYRGECGEKTWLMRIAINTCKDMLRSAWFKHIDKRVTPDELPEPVTAPNEADVELTLAVMRLPQRLKDVVLLYYYENMTMTEIAQTLGIAQSSVSTRLKRAYTRLRAMLEGGRSYE